MRDPNIVLDILRQRSINNVEIKDIYPLLYKESFYLLAYNKLSKNDGALTPGETGETIDGMSLKRIDSIIEEMRYERYKWHAQRIKDIPKKNGGFRTLCIEEWRDKLVQEVLRMILSAIYEPKFSDASHGFRPNRGCHTALTRIVQKGRGAEWFIEGDIEKCFDSIDHNILLNILRKTIKDNRIIELLRKMLKAGKFDNEFNYHQTYSGAPQGGVLSPLLANIYLNELDQFIETKLYPEFNKGESRPKSNYYNNTTHRIINAERKLNKHPEQKEVIIQKLKELRKIQRSMKSKVPSEYDNSFRRLSYTRYADDWIITFIGTKKEAEDIKNRIGVFLKNNLGLVLSDTKTKLTKASDEKNPARFLGYNIITQWSNDHIANGQRTVSGDIALLIPYDVYIDKRKRYMKNQKPIHIGYRTLLPVYDIIAAYQAEFRGIVQYYKFARNQKLLSSMKWIIEISLMKTLANKFRTTVAKMYKRYSSYRVIDGKKYKVIQETITNKDGKQNSTYFGGIPLKVVKPSNKNTINDSIVIYKAGKTSVAQRLQDNVCELCGSDKDIEVHHIHALKDIKNKNNTWKKLMIAMNRRTLVVCRNCHRSVIHSGKYDGKKI